MRQARNGVKALQEIYQQTSNVISTHAAQEGFPDYHLRRAHTFTHCDLGWNVDNHSNKQTKTVFFLPHEYLDELLDELQEEHLHELVHVGGLGTKIRDSRATREFAREYMASLKSGLALMERIDSLESKTPLEDPQEQV